MFKKSAFVSGFLTIYLVVAPLVGSTFLGAWIIGQEKELQSYGVWQWLIVTIICTFTSALAITPPTLLALAFAYFLGWIALGPLFMLNMCAIVGVYWLIGRFDKKILLAFFSKQPRTQTFLNQISDNQFRFVFFAKLSPVLPFALTNVMFSLSNLRLKNILLGGVAGMLPRTILAVWAGREAHQLRKLIENPDDGLRSKLLLAALFIVSVWGIWQIFKKRL
jgi:uncharacterized membrane protein YdjX (TVP38/TMEM64 family)